MNLQQDEEFTDFLRIKAREGMESVKYPATKFRRMLDGDGGFETVKRFLAAPRVSEGYTELVMRGRPDLTVEALVAQTHWRTQVVQSGFAEVHRYVQDQRSLRTSRTANWSARPIVAIIPELMLTVLTRPSAVDVLDQ